MLFSVKTQSNHSVDSIHVSQPEPAVANIIKDDHPYKNQSLKSERIHDVYSAFQNR